MPPPSPTVAQWELSVRVRERRKQLGLDAGTVSKAVGVSRNYWSAVENDRTILARDKLEELAPVLQFDDAELQILLDLHRVARGARWWNEYEALLDEDLLQVFGLEYGAVSLQIYEAQLITGLLQTEEYTRTLLIADPRTSEVSVRQRLELRKRRQARLTDEASPLRLTLLMSEAAVVQQYGGPAVLRRQLDHLVACIDSLPGSLEVRIVPFTATPLGMAGASTIQLMDFESEFLPTVVWREAVTPIGITEVPEEVEAVRVNYVRALTESSLSRVDSRKLILDRISILGS